MSYYGMSGFGGFGAVSLAPVTKTVVPGIKPFRATTTREGTAVRTVDTSAPPEEFIQSQFVADVACAPGLVATTSGCINPDLVSIDPNAPPPPAPKSDVVDDTKGWWEKRTQNEKILIGAAGALVLLGLLRR